MPPARSASSHGDQPLRAGDADGRAAHPGPGGGRAPECRGAGPGAAPPAPGPRGRGADRVWRVASPRPRPLAGALVIRPATPADSAAIAAIWNREVRETAATTDTEERTVESQRAWLAAHGPDHPVVVAVDADEVVAFGALSPYRAKPSYAPPVADSVSVKDRR